MKNLEYSSSYRTKYNCGGFDGKQSYFSAEARVGCIFNVNFLPSIESCVAENSIAQVNSERRWNYREFLGTAVAD